MGVVNGFKHRLARFELHSGLVVVAYPQGLPKVHHALHPAAEFRLPAARDKVQEGGLAGCVPPHYPNAFIPLEIICEVLQVAFSVPVEAEVTAVYDLVAKVGALDLGLGHIHLLCDVGILGPFLNVPECLLAVFCLSGAGAGTGVHPLQFTAEQVTHFLRFRVIVVYPFLPLLKEIHIISAVDEDAAAVHFHYGVANPVQEVAVMGDHEKSASGVLQMALQKLYGIYVKVVGGLVHYVEIGL